MSLKTACYCGTKAFDSQDDARFHWDRMTARGVSDELPTGVRECGQGVWHLVYDRPPATLKATSAKRDRENRERKQMIDEMFPDGRPRCIRPGCTRLADDVHEPLTRGRGGDITDPDNAAPLCRTDHDEITFGGDPQWAYDLELLVHSWDKRTPARIAADRRRALEDARAEIAERALLAAEWSREVPW